MEALAGQPFEFNDFSGGMTDNVFDGDQRRYLKAQNFLITTDKKLQLRDGTIVYDSVGYQLTTAPRSRINGLFVAQSESVLLALTSRSFYVQYASDSAWTKIPGKGSNETLTDGGVFNQVTTAEFQKQVFYTSDAPAQPGKLYKDSTNTWVAKTVGLPQMNGVSNYPGSALLSKCIALANALRTSMISHFTDATAYTYPSAGNSFSLATIQHGYVDHPSLAFFQSVVLSPGEAYYDPATGTYTTTPPTPAPAATDQATLFTLATALANAYTAHRLVVNGFTGYHQLLNIRGNSNVGQNMGIFATIAAKTTPTTLAEAAALLDDIHTKHYWHQMAPYIHSNSGNYSVMARYLVPASYKVGTITAGEPLVTPNYGPFIDMVNYLKASYNAHATGDYIALNDPTAMPSGNQHFQTDKFPITLQNANDFDSAALMTFWLRFLYYYHWADASFNNPRVAITFTSVAGSANLTSIVNIDTGLAYNSTLNYWIGSYTPTYAGGVFNANPAADSFSAQVTATGTGTATVSRSAIASNSLNLGSISPSYMHGAWLNNARISASSATKTDLTTEIMTAGAQAIGNSLATWLVLAEDFALTFGAHNNDNFVHKVARTLSYGMSDVIYYGAAQPGLVNGNSFYIPVAVSYVYSFFYADSYQVETDGLTYLTRGNPVQSQLVNTMASFPVGTVITSEDSTLYPDTTISSQAASATITYITPLTNAGGLNYDLTNVTEEIYRTTSGGTVGYLLSSKANGTTSFVDYVNDTLTSVAYPALITGKPLYTNGGVLGTDQPPKSKFIHLLNGFMYYGGVYDTNGTLLPNRILQSTQGEPDGVPAANTLDLDDELTALSSAQNVPVALCKNSIYRIEGNFDSTGKGLMTAVKLGDAMGCLNAKSVVKTEIGLFFAGSDGFYWTNGFSLIKISIDLNATYQSLTSTDSQKLCIQGAYDKITRRVWWSLRSQSSASVNDIFFIFYLDYGVKPSGVFTTANSFSRDNYYGTAWAPASCVFYKTKLIIGDEQGYLFKSDQYTKTDPRIDVASSPAFWATTQIPWDFISCSLNFGTTFKRKWITKMQVSGLNVGNAAIQLQSIKDNNSTGAGIQDLVPIQYHGNPTWGDANCIWGDTTQKWKYDGDIDAIRRFPASSMRSDFRQFRYYPADITVYRSDDYPFGSLANVDAGANTATIVTPSGYTLITWPLDVMDMRICFETDNYATEYAIVALDGTFTVITFGVSAGQAAPTTLNGIKWMIKGVKKEQRINISSFVVHYGYLGDKVTNVNGSSDSGGENDNA